MLLFLTSIQPHNQLVSAHNDEQKMFSFLTYLILLQEVATITPQPTIREQRTLFVLASNKAEDISLFASRFGVVVCCDAL
jgi:hypothetical protein